MTSKSLPLLKSKVECPMLIQEDRFKAVCRMQGKDEAAATEGGGGRAREGGTG